MQFCNYKSIAIELIVEKSIAIAIITAIFKKSVCDTKILVDANFSGLKSVLLY